MVRDFPKVKQNKQSVTNGGRGFFSRKILYYYYFYYLFLFTSNWAEIEHMNLFLRYEFVTNITIWVEKPIIEEKL